MASDSLSHNLQVEPRVAPRRRYRHPRRLSHRVALPADRRAGFMAATVAVPARPRAVEKASSLVGYLRSRLGEVELRRRLWHMLPGLLPFVLWIIPHDAPTSMRFQLVVGIGGSLAAAVMILKFSQIRRQGEANRDSVMAVLGYAGSGLGMMLLFPGELQLATGVLAVLAFGDGSATLGGLLLGGR